MKTAWMVLLSLVTAATAQAEVYKLEVVRNGVTYRQVAGNFWQGEYPGPVVNVSSETKGTTTIQGWASLRTLTDRKACTIQNGLYHPWSDNQPSLINFYTIAGREDYQVTKNIPAAQLEDLVNYEGQSFKDAGLSLKAGDKIVNVFYLSEGWAEGTLVQNGKQTTISFFFDFFEQKSGSFKLIEKTDSLRVSVYPGAEGEPDEVYYSGEQWLYLNCAEGYNVFVEEIDLLQQPGVSEGFITGYGEISNEEPTWWNE